MNPAVKELWVNALRSGGYEQGKGRLVTLVDRDGEPEYCCLGVLCDIAVKAGVFLKAKEYNVPGKMVSTISYDDMTSCLPFQVMEWAGLRSSDPRVLTGDELHPLSNLNDQGTPFYRIAKLIEEQL